MAVSTRRKTAFSPVEARLFAILAPPLFVANDHYFRASNGRENGIGAELASAACVGALAVCLGLLIRAAARMIERGLGVAAAGAFAPEARWHRRYGDIATAMLSFLSSRYAARILAENGVPTGSLLAASGVGALALLFAVAMTGVLYAGTAWSFAIARRTERQGNEVGVDGDG